MMSDAGHIDEEAIGWLIRLRDPAFADWDAFTAWLEQDPRHLAAYEEAALADDEVADVPETPTPTSPIIAPHAPRRPTRRLVLGSAVAASLLAVFGLSTLQSGTRSIETSPGEHRTVTLAGGSRIELNGDTRILLDEDNARFASIERGEALFTIVHDDANPFTVEAGDATLLDVGTVFNVTRLDKGVKVAVSEGAVLFNPAGEKVHVPAGKSLEARGGAQPQVRTIAMNDVGGWREGRLVYSDAPLAAVADDLTRNLGQEIRIAGDASRPFSGVIMLDREDPRFVESLGPLLGTEVSRSGEGWTLTAR